MANKPGDMPLPNSDRVDEASKASTDASNRLVEQANAERRVGQAGGDKTSVNDLIAMTGDAKAFDAKTPDALSEKYGPRIALLDRDHQRDLSGAVDYYVSTAVNDDHRAALQQYKAAFEQHYTATA